MKKKRVILFGAGRILKIFMKLYDRDKVEILAICDNDSKVQGTAIGGIKVCKPDEISRTECEYAIVTSTYFDDIRMQIVSLGVKAEKIINFYEIYQKLSVYDEAVFEMLRDEILFLMPAQRSYESEMQKIMDMQEKNLFLNAKTIINSMQNKVIDSLEEVEFQVFSQFGQDGIIQWLIQNVTLNEHIFIEFGVENYMESNTRFLLMNNNWKGLVIDGDKENIKYIKNWKHFWKYDLTAVDRFITRDNINHIITEAGFKGDIGLLSIDIDGNDYWILNAVRCVAPRILICEYNDVFGSDKRVSVPYDENFFRTEKHYSNLYWGASIKAFCDWGEKNGYYYVGSNSAGNDAFFVRKDCIDINKIPRESTRFIKSKYRQSRDEKGSLTYLRDGERMEVIKEMELVNLENNCIESIANIYHL